MTKTHSYMKSKPQVKEKSFSLSINAYVHGYDARGIKFTEETLIKNISSEKAIFVLKTKIPIGTKLKASLLIPKTFILEHPLELTIFGEVIKAVKDSSNHNEQNIHLRLNKKFRIQKSI